MQLKRRLADSFMYHGTKRDLELECVTTLSFGRSYDSILEQVRSSSSHWSVVMITLVQPCWIILINLVSLDFLRTSFAQQPGEVISSHTLLVISHGHNMI